MMRWEIGTVKHVVKRWPDSEEVSVIMEGGEEALAFHDVQIQGPLEPGDKVLLNITAAELRLGSGGVHSWPLGSLGRKKCGETAMFLKAI